MAKLIRQRHNIFFILVKVQVQYHHVGVGGVALDGDDSYLAGQSSFPSSYLFFINTRGLRIVLCKIPT